MWGSKQVPRASSGVLGQLSKCHESSGKHEFAHKHTPLPPLPSYTTHMSCSNLHAEQVNFCVCSSKQHILLQGYGPHTLILPTTSVTNKVISFLFAYSDLSYTAHPRDTWIERGESIRNKSAVASLQAMGSGFTGRFIRSWEKKTRCWMHSNLQPSSSRNFIFYLHHISPSLLSAR